MFNLDVFPPRGFLICRQPLGSLLGLSPISSGLRFRMTSIEVVGVVRMVPVMQRYASPTLALRALESSPWYTITIFGQCV